VHLKTIPNERADSMAGEQGPPPGPPDGRPKELAERPPRQVEGPVEPLPGVGDSIDPLDSTASQQRPDVIVGPLVNDHEPQASRLDPRQGHRQVGDRLAAEDAAGVAEKHE
jgi:hypothetical protein